MHVSTPRLDQDILPFLESDPRDPQQISELVHGDLSPSHPVAVLMS